MKAFQYSMLHYCYNLSRCCFIKCPDTTAVLISKQQMDMWFQCSIVLHQLKVCIRFILINFAFALVSLIRATLDQSIYAVILSHKVILSERNNVILASVGKHVPNIIHLYYAVHIPRNVHVKGIVQMTWNKLCHHSFGIVISPRGEGVKALGVCLTERGKA